jgi:hypothetical protein
MPKRRDDAEDCDRVGQYQQHEGVLRVTYGQFAWYGPLWMMM